MNAVVDDLTNYLGPDPNASGDGGFTKVYQATAGQTWTLTPDAADGHDVRLLAAESARATVRTSRPATSASTCSAFPARTIRAPAIQRYAGYPEFSSHTGFSAARQPRRLEPDLPRRADLLARHQPHEDQGPARLPRRLLPELLLPRSLAAGNRQSARPVRLQRRTRRRCAAARRPTTSTTSTPSFLLGLRRHAEQERAERADDRARVAARAVLPRSVDADRRS